MAHMPGQTTRQEGSLTKIFARRLLTPGGWRENMCVSLSDGLIRSVEPGSDGDLRFDCLTAGLFETHAHGGEGFGTKYADMDLLKDYLVGQAHAGITDVLIGLYAHIDGDDYRVMMDFTRAAMELQARGGLPGAHIRGVHLEGPFLNPARNGGMLPEAMLRPSPATYDHLFGEYDDIVQLVTLAPEMPGACELTAHLTRKGICVQAGHTDASYEQACEAFSLGVTSMCHTFNAARGIHHRQPGILTAALLGREVYCEAICDFHHLHPAAVELIYRMKGADRMIAISDSANVTGLADGEYTLHGETCLVIDGTPRAHGGGTLSGGACYLDGCVRNLISIGISPEEAVRMASRTPAERLGLRGMGCVQAGCRAHLAAWSDTWHCEKTIIGEKIYGKE